MPRVTVGMPVFNGENFLEEALQSLVDQEFTDFELIIGDNGSTDDTEAICRRYAAKYPWVSYLRSPENKGAAWNFNRLVAPARGEYFIWMAHDDVFAPSLLAKSVAVLDAVPDAVLCSAGVQDIDERGEPMGDWRTGSPPRNGDPVYRFGDVLRRTQWHQAFALIRTDVLRRTHLFGAFIGSDAVLLAELALRGQFAEVNEPLFLNRQHKESSTEAFSTHYGRNEWWDPRLRGKLVFPMWRLLGESFLAICRAPLRIGKRFDATIELSSWALSYWKPLLGTGVWILRQLRHRKQTS